MGKHYSHLSAEDRAVIMLEVNRGGSLRSIAQLLGRHVSTVSRELRRNECGGSVRVPLITGISIACQ